MQLLPAVAGRFVVRNFARRLAGFCRRGRLALALGLFTREHFGLATRLLLGAALAILFIAAPSILFLETLAIEPLLLQPLVLGPLECGLRLLLGLALTLDFLLLVSSLVLEHLALDVGTLAAHLDVHGPSTPLRTRELELGLRLAP